MSILEDLELSVRAYNALNNMGTVNTLDDFMALDRKTVMALKGAGVRTWKEVREVQASLHPQETYARRWEIFMDAVGYVNRLMVQEPTFRTCDAGRGFLVAVRSGKREAELRMQESD